MSRSRVGFTLVELLVVLAIMGVLLGVAATFLSQQSRVTAASQARNEAELAARTVAEGVAQDLQMAGSRAIYVGGNVLYGDVGGANACNEKNRSGCVLAWNFSGAGEPTVALTNDDINGYTMFYRSSLDAAEPCRRVDFAHIGTVLYRSDVPCSPSISSVDLDASAFAERVTSFDVEFVCSVPPNPGDPIIFSNPSACYTVADNYVTQVFVTVQVDVGGRMPASSTMRLESATPNLRPSVDYGLPSS